MSRSEKPVVFVVDDDAAMRESLGSVIGLLGLPVRCFSSARQFLDEYDRTSRGCLVVDVRMPGMSGVELHEQLVGEGVRLPTIYITGLAMPELTTAERQRGVVAAFQKPFPPADLLDAIRHAIEGQRETP